MSNCPDREVRCGWMQRILDHDGFEIGGVKDPAASGLAAPGRRPGLTRAGSKTSAT